MPFTARSNTTSRGARPLRRGMISTAASDASSRRWGTAVGPALIVCLAAPAFFVLLQPLIGVGLLALGVGAAIARERGRVAASAPSLARDLSLIALGMLVVSAISLEAKLDDPFDTLHFHIPRQYFDNLALAGGRPPMGDLRIVSGKGFHDPVIAHLGLAMTAALDHSRELSQLFLDQAMVALCTHIAGAYGTEVEPRTLARGLAEWQLKRARDMIASRLDGNVTITEIAAACGLTPSYFAKQFARATGMTPHRWLLRMRVDRGRQLLLEGRLTIADIAIACGFADQSHFTRVFSREVGTAPKAWRDAQRR